MKRSSKTSAKKPSPAKKAAKKPARSTAIGYKTIEVMTDPVKGPTSKEVAAAHLAGKTQSLDAFRRLIGW